MNVITRLVVDLSRLREMNVDYEVHAVEILHQNEQGEALKTTKLKIDIPEANGYHGEGSKTERLRV